MCTTKFERQPSGAKVTRGRSIVAPKPTCRTRRSLNPVHGALAVCVLLGAAGSAGVAWGQTIENIPEGPARRLAQAWTAFYTCDFDKAVKQASTSGARANMALHGLE